LPAIIADLNRFRPEVVNGFVSAIHQLACYVIQENIPLTFSPVAIFTTSESLLQHHRKAIQEAFGTRVYDQYASAEGAPFITECRSGNLHYNLDTGVIESIDLGNGPEMVVTSFTTHGTPLIRYQIGDRVSFRNGLCDCGSAHPLVQSIDGRAVDYLYSPSKGKVSLSHLADVIKGLSNCVKEMQFIQTSLSSIEVRVVVDEAAFRDVDAASILAALAFRFGSDMKIDIIRVDSIPREKSGKFRLIKNLISNERPKHVA
jgi:phenylacetate-CoA ligase